MSRQIRLVRLPVLLAAGLFAGLACSIASASAAANHPGAMRNLGFLAAPPPLPPVAVAPPIEINTSGHNEAGVPNTSTPGIIGTGAMPSGLVGDSVTAPGFPAIVGR